MIDPLSRHILGIQERIIRRLWEHVRYRRRYKRKGREKYEVFLGLGMTQPIDHARADMTSRLAGIELLAYTFDHVSIPCNYQRKRLISYAIHVTIRGNDLPRVRPM